MTSATERPCRSASSRRRPNCSSVSCTCVRLMMTPLYDCAMHRKLIPLALCLVALAACKKKEEPAPAPAPAAETAAHETAPPPKTPQPTVTLAGGAPIPAQGVALWLVADDAQPGKLAAWTNSAVGGVTA